MPGCPPAAPLPPGSTSWMATEHGSHPGWILRAANTVSRLVGRNTKARPFTYRIGGSGRGAGKPQRAPGGPAPCAPAPSPGTPFGSSRKTPRGSGLSERRLSRSWCARAPASGSSRALPFRGNRGPRETLSIALCSEMAPDRSSSRGANDSTAEVDGPDELQDRTKA